MSIEKGIMIIIGEWAFQNRLLHIQYVDFITFSAFISPYYSNPAYYNNSSSMKNLCTENRRLNLQKALSDCPEGAIWALCSSHYHFEVRGLSSVTNQKWLVNLPLPRQCINSLGLAMKYRPIPKSGSFKSRYGLLCVCLRLIARCWIVSPVRLSHTRRAEWGWLFVTGFEKWRQVSARQGCREVTAYG